jgi:hypothetical protein
VSSSTWFAASLSLILRFALRGENDVVVSYPLSPYRQRLFSVVHSTTADTKQTHPSSGSTIITRHCAPLCAHSTVPTRAFWETVNNFSIEVCPCSDLKPYRSSHTHRISASSFCLLQEAIGPRSAGWPSSSLFLSEEARIPTGPSGHAPG